jgi:hypothetical protein
LTDTEHVTFPPALLIFSPTVVPPFFHDEIETLAAGALELTLVYPALARPDVICASIAALSPDPV